MKQPSIDRIRDILKLIVWDYNIDPYDLYLIAIHQRELIGTFNDFWVWQRMLERLGWYKNRTRKFNHGIYPKIPCPGVKRSI